MPAACSHPSSNSSIAFGANPFQAKWSLEEEGLLGSQHASPPPNKKNEDDTSKMCRPCHATFGMAKASQKFCIIN